MSNSYLSKYQKRKTKPNRILLKHKASGHKKYVKLGFSLTTLFFGPLVPLFRGEIKLFFISLVGSIATFGIGWVVFSFTYYKYHIDYLLENGYEPAGKHTRKKLKKIDLLHDKIDTGSKADYSTSNNSRTLKETKSTPEKSHREIHLDDLRDLAPRQFENYTAKLFESLGWDTNLTPQGGDKGVDIEISDGSRKAAIQCKRYGGGNKIGVSKVREYASLLHKKDTDYQFVAIVTTSGFTKSAKKEAKEFEHLKIVKGDELLEKFNNHFEVVVKPQGDKLVSRKENRAKWPF